MLKGKGAYRLISVVAVLALIAGTQGFVISTHTCASCGTHEQHVALFGSTAGSSHTCTPQAEAQSKSSCCHPDEGASETTGTSMHAPVCEAEVHGTCCTHESERVVVETNTTEKSSRLAVKVQASAFVLLPEPAMPVTPAFSFSRPNCTGYGGSMDILRRNCCMLL